MKALLLWIKWLILIVLFSYQTAFAEDPNTEKNEAAALFHTKKVYSSISANPAAVNLLTGSGALQKYIEHSFGIQNNHGIRLGGLLVGDVNRLFTGGIPQADRWTTNGLLILDLSADMEKLVGLKGGLLDIQFLRFDGQETNAQAGSAQGYNSLPGHTPLNRSELYQLWYRQELFNDKFIFRIGKTVPSEEFGNVSRPIPLARKNLAIPAVSGLIFTPLFVNPTMYVVMPGYYNSAYGITINIAPTKKWYLSLGVYDGALAQGVQTGIRMLPTLNGTYFYIGETGFAWLLGKNKKPGYIGIGAWHQAGKIITSPTLSESSASGLYLYGTQRLWYQHPGEDTKGVSGFYQVGWNNASSLPMEKYIGAGLTGFGLFKTRSDDTIGLGLALSWLNQKLFNRRTELMLQTYYQAQIVQNFYLEPAITYIPTPGGGKNLNATWTGTLRGIVSF